MAHRAPPIARKSGALRAAGQGLAAGAGRRLGAAALALASAAAGGCGDNLFDPFVSLVRVSGTTPFPGGCGGGGQQGTNFDSVEVEPWVAVDPTNPAHLVGTWQQDRWSNGGANGIGVAVSFDGGATWSTHTPRIGRCGGAAASADYQRASDPWVTFAADGTAFLIALVFDPATPRNAMLASRSTDGGVSWSDPAVLIADEIGRAHV